MVGYFCATPFHVIAAITMQSGMFAHKNSTLIVLNHFDVDDKMIEEIKATGIFNEVLLFNCNNKTNFNRFKRLVNVFAPQKLMRFVANKTSFTHFVCFALDFFNLTYLIDRYEKRGVSCEFSFGDDGIGTYIREGIYRPKPFATKLLKLNGRLKFMDRPKKIYAYKPEYMAANKGYEVCKIEQTEAICKKRKDAIQSIWKLEEEISLDNQILYFEQPSEANKNVENQKIECAAIDKAAKVLKAQVTVKLHPRTSSQEKWEKYSVLKTKTPYEVMLLEKQFSPALLMTVDSTALFSVYLFDGLPAANCPSVLLYKLMVHQNQKLTEALSCLCEVINASMQTPRIFNPDTIEQLELFLSEAAQNKL